MGGLVFFSDEGFVTAVTLSACAVVACTAVAGTVVEGTVVKGSIVAGAVFAGIVSRGIVVEFTIAVFDVNPFGKIIVFRVAWFLLLVPCGFNGRLSDLSNLFSKSSVNVNKAVVDGAAADVDVVEFGVVEGTDPFPAIVIDGEGFGASVIIAFLSIVPFHAAANS